MVHDRELKYVCRIMVHDREWCMTETKYVCRIMVHDRELKYVCRIMVHDRELNMCAGSGA